MSELCSCRPYCKPVNGRCGVLVDAAVWMAWRAKPGATLEEREEIERAHGRVPYREQLARAWEERGRSGDERDLPWRMQRLGVPSDALVSLQRLQTGPEWQALEAARRFMGAPGEWCNYLVLVGDTGLGKTVAAAWVFREVARRTSPDLPTGSTEPLQWVRASLFTGLSAFSREDDARVSAMKKAALLVVDEVGMEATPIGVSTLQDVLLYREGQGKRSVVISNVRSEAFRAKYGEALWDRFQARGVVPVLKGKSMRARAVEPRKAP